MNGVARTIERASASWLVGCSSLLGISACLGDLVMTHLLGTWYPGYRPSIQPMSDLGNSASPVALTTTRWWMMMGLLFVAFGYGFYRAFSHQGTHASRAAWLIALYGIGEGLGSGLAAGTPGSLFDTPASIIHNILGGVGVLSAVALPLVIMKIYPALQSPRLYRYSRFTTAAGLLFLVLFVFSTFHHPAGSWISHSGLWQRLFMVVYYLFFICLAVLMLMSLNARSEDGNGNHG